MLIVSRRFAILSTTLPAVLLYHDVPATEINHRLNADTHSFFKEWPDTATSIIGDFGILMHFTAYAMTAHLADHSVTVAFAIRLHCICDVTDTFAFLCGSNAFIK